jgi:penicillin-binding protein 2
MDVTARSINLKRVVSTIWRWWLVSLLLVILNGCGFGSQEDEQTTTPLPTRIHIPTETPEYNNPEDAEIVVRSFLSAWGQNDFETMYQLISLAAQEAIGYPAFQALYEGVHAEMRLQEISHALRLQAQESNRVMLFVYDVTFNTTISGMFTDANREIRLVLDGENWRVAWTPANIFVELRGGATLRQTISTPNRASIYDRNGEILADMNGRFVIVRVIQSQIPDFAACVSTLASALDTPPEEIQARLANFALEWLVDIGTLEIEAYHFWKESLETNCGSISEYGSLDTRRYLDGDLAPHIVGVVSYPNVDEIPAIEAVGFQQDSILGRTGIEGSWDETLRGQPGGQLMIVSPGGDVLRILAETVTQPGQSVYLTLDSDLQRFIRQEFVQLYGYGGIPDSNGAAAVVLDVNTGAVLAMVSYPTYNANAFIPYPIIGSRSAQEIIEEVQQDERRPQLNRAAQGRYPAGSTMKPMTTIAALASGEYTTDETYISTGTWKKDVPRTDWLAGGHGRLTLAQAITHSCNSCFYEVGYRLDNVDHTLLPDYMRQLGLGVSTGLTDIAESTGLIGTPEIKYELVGIPWTFSDAVDMAIGQGFVEVTPLQIARTYGAIANNGLLYRPQLVDRVALVDDVSYRMTPESTGIDIDTDILDYVRGGMCEVVTGYYGTATRVFEDSRLLNIGVCGKTGTAQNPGGISHAWFTAYAPAENPQIVITVMVENSGEGSVVSAPIVRRILEYYFFELDAAPTAR